MGLDFDISIKAVSSILPPTIATSVVIQLTLAESLCSALSVSIALYFVQHNPGRTSGVIETSEEGPWYRRQVTDKMRVQHT